MSNGQRQLVERILYAVGFIVAMVTVFAFIARG